MSYRTHNFQTGQTIEAPPINEMDDQIRQNEQDIIGLKGMVGNSTMGTSADTLTGAIAEHEQDISSLNSDKINKPASSPNGTAGQILQSNGDGSTSWVNVVPGDAGHITPAMFGAIGDGVADDTDELSNTFARSNAVIEGGNKYYKIKEIVITERNNLVIRNFRFYHGISITLKHCENIIFQNCVWDEFNDNGIANKNVHCVILTTIHTGSEEWVQANNWRADEVCKNITFDNCQFLGTHFTENTPSLYNNNKPHYNTGICLRLEGVDGLRVVGCYFTQNRGNACIHQNCYAPLGDFEITDNLFYLNCWGGISLYRQTGMPGHPTRVIQGNRFIGHGLGYLPWWYLEQFPEKERGVGTAVLYGGHYGRTQNEPVFCEVYNNIFEDNNESSIEGWIWNPIKNNTILGNGMLQTAESVVEMKAKYMIPYTLYVRINPSQNPIYQNLTATVPIYPPGEVRSIEGNTIARFYGTSNPILIRGNFYEQFIVRNNSMTDEELASDKNAKFVHFLNSTFYGGMVWKNNIGMRPYFNNCTFQGGEYDLDEMMDIYDCHFNTQAFDDLSDVGRFQSIRCARFSNDVATVRSNDVSNVVNGKPTLTNRVIPVEQRLPDPIWDIRNQSGYGENGYVFGGETTQTVVDTNISLGATDTNWTIFVDTQTTGDNDAGDNSYLIRLLSFSDDSENTSLQFGSRYRDQAWTYIFPNDYYGYETTYRIDGSTSQNFLAPGHASKFVLRHARGSGKIEIFAMQRTQSVSVLSSINCGEYSFTSGTTGTLRFGGAIVGGARAKAYYNGVIKEAKVYNTLLTDSEVSVIMLGTDVTPHVAPTPIYDIANESGFVEGVGMTMDGSTAIDTGVALLEDTSDFTIVTKFKFDNMTENGRRPNFTFIPVYSAMSAPMAQNTHTGNTDKGICVGLSLQDGSDLADTAKGGFIYFRRDWRYNGCVEIDMYNYTSYFTRTYTSVVIRKNGVIKVYDTNLLEIGRLTGDYATSIVNGNLTIGARMGYSAGYTDFFKGVIQEFKVYDKALNLIDIEADHPSIYDNEASVKGAVIYHLDNKTNTQKSVRYALVELNYDLGEYNSAAYTQLYPIAFGVRMDKIYDDVLWVPCSSSKRVLFAKLCKWDAVYDPFESWDIEIINPGTVPNMALRIDGIKVVLLSKESGVPETVDATDFNISWDGDITDIGVGESVTGFTQYVPIGATAGTTLTATSENTDVATVDVDGFDVTISGVSEGETLIHVSIPYGTEHVYSVVVTGE